MSNRDYYPKSSNTRLNELFTSFKRHLMLIFSFPCLCFKLLFAYEGTEEHCFKCIHSSNLHNHNCMTHKHITSSIEMLHTINWRWFWYKLLMWFRWNSVFRIDFWRDEMVYRWLWWWWWSIWWMWNMAWWSATESKWFFDLIKKWQTILVAAMIYNLTMMMTICLNLLMWLCLWRWWAIFNVHFRWSILTDGYPFVCIWKDDDNLLNQI